MATKRTYQPSKVKRARTHGFLVRSRTKGGSSCLGCSPRQGTSRSCSLIERISRRKLAVNATVNKPNGLPRSIRLIKSAEFGAVLSANKTKLIRSYSDFFHN